CLAAVSAAVREGRSVVVDNTNGDSSVRRMFVDAAKKAGAKAVRALWFKAGEDVCKHNALFRALSWRADGREVVPDIAFRVFKGKFNEPTVAEGFVRVTEVEFMPVFESEEMKAKWSKWHF
ncbi:hypothetical protein HK405_012975, partial [Cladochytrium tenue]